jgi:hypothetical protein
MATCRIKPDGADRPNTEEAARVPRDVARPDRPTRRDPLRRIITDELRRPEIEATDLAILEALDAIVDENGWTSEHPLRRELDRRGVRLPHDALRKRLTQLRTDDLADHRDGRWGIGGAGWDLLHT